MPTKSVLSEATTLNEDTKMFWVHWWYKHKIIFDVINKRIILGGFMLHKYKSELHHNRNISPLKRYDELNILSRGYWCTVRVCVSSLHIIEYTHTEYQNHVVYASSPHRITLKRHLSEDGLVSVARTAHAHRKRLRLRGHRMQRPSRSQQHVGITRLPDQCLGAFAVS